MAQWKQPQGGKSLPKPDPGSGDAQLKDETFQNRNENENIVQNNKELKSFILKICTLYYLYNITVEQNPCC